jgi:hypothetical protein
MSDLPQRLKDLLVREAHLKVSRDQLTPVLTEKEAELKAIQAARPTFLLLMPKPKREEYLAQLSAAQETVKILRAGLHVIDRCDPHIKRMVEEEIEVLLRKDCVEYAEALAARRQKEDWSRCLERFAEKIFEFTRALGNVRNAVCSGYVRDTHVYSQGAVQAFLLAISAAQKVEEEVGFANRISELQLQHFSASGVETRPLPRLSETRYAPWVSNISSLPLAEAQTQFDALIAEMKTLYETGIPELRAQADYVDATQASDIHNFLLSAWDQFREEVAPEVLPADTEDSVAQTERMLLSQARNSVLGRL